MTEAGEFLYVVDANNIPLTPELRSTVLKKNMWRRAAGGILFDPCTKKTLCHQRSDMKDERGGKWTALFGGKSIWEETDLDTTIRELGEEFHIKLDKSRFIFLTLIKSEERRQFEYVYLALALQAECRIEIDQKEVTQNSWIEAQRLPHLLNTDSTWYNYGYESNIVQSLAFPAFGTLPKKTIAEIEAISAKLKC